ncbi:hypothetical protein ACP4OV_003378 [Aristida adscensionis]
MTTTPEEFFVEESTRNRSLPSPSVTVQDVPAMLDDERQGPFFCNDMAISYISRLLMEEGTDDDDDDLLCQYYDDPALLRVQQPFAQILSSASFGVDNNSNTIKNTGNMGHEANDLLQNYSSGCQVALDLTLSKGVDVVGEFLKGMQEAQMLLPRDGCPISKDQENSSRPGWVKKRHISREVHQDEAAKASKAVIVKQPEEIKIGVHKMIDEMMRCDREAWIMGIKNLSIAKTREAEQKKKTKKSISGRVARDVDLCTLLIRCAQAVTENNHASAFEILKQIKRYASATGDATQRLAECFAKGLEARLTGIQVWRLITAEPPSYVEFLRAYKLYVSASCFFIVAGIHKVHTIMDAMVGRNKVHLVDYGPYYGFHLVGLLYSLSTCREGSPPEVRITTIGHPCHWQSCPIEQSDKIGHMLSICAREFGLPFQFHTITKKREDVCIGDLNIDANEVLVVNDLFNLSTLMDESIFFDQTSPRDSVLNNIREMRPDVFIQSTVNYSHGTFFRSRFQDTLYHYTSLFDMLDATIPRKSVSRLVLEQSLLGHAALNAVACEGAELMDRPQKYKQWQTRNHRAGLKQLPLKQNIVRLLEDTMKKHYHKDFFICQDGQWLLQGWKGRILYAHSAWVVEDTSSE